MVERFDELAYAERLRDLLTGALTELNAALATEGFPAMTANAIVVGPPGVQLEQTGIFILPATRSYPESISQATHHTVGSDRYIEWARHVHAGMNVHVQARFVPDADAAQAATRAVCKLTDAVEVVLLRNAVARDWWNLLDIESVSEVEALRLPTVDGALVAARQIALRVWLKERVDTTP